ncbi:UNVERIFIED_CONTAM: hypothetical protein Sangu_0112800 [Sesamum angustifolium]|uniref:Uncharacterized protein n=1 Tax=Sesamum angustifolium TaxID=2727405 RepID=A0AAW2RKH5_9LAMI
MNFESLQMVVTERRELPIRPVFLKFGVALAISLGGVIYTFSRTKRIKPSKSKSLKLSSGNGSQVDLKGALRDDELALQLADHAKVVMELEAAKAKIKLLRKKFRSEAEQNRDQISTLKERVMKLQELEKKADELDRDVEVYRQEKEELKGELEETKKSKRPEAGKFGFDS